MEKKMVMVSGFAGFLGFLSAVLAFAAEATRIKASDVTIKSKGHCVYPKSSALDLGLVSAILVTLAQAVINSFAGCICCQRISNRSNTNWIIALISFIGSWFCFIIAFLLLLTGAALNDQRGMQKMYFGKYCYVVKPGVFSGGALLSLFSVSLGLIYYFALKNPQSSMSSGLPLNYGITLGQPQFTPRRDEPVFVHEDNYKRQQIP